jgi:hypothetical protein
MWWSTPSFALQNSFIWAQEHWEWVDRIIMKPKVFGIGAMLSYGDTTE